MRVDYNFGSQYQIAWPTFDRDGSLDMSRQRPPTSARYTRRYGQYRERVSWQRRRHLCDGRELSGRSGRPGSGFAVVTADLNQDQIPDLVMRALPSSVSLTSDGAATIVARLGNGDGTFGPRSASRPAPILSVSPSRTLMATASWT
jgi:hypothetical protein